MLVNLEEILRLAEAKKIAVGSFNTPNLESVMAVIGAAEELGVPVILMHAEVHEPIMPIDIIGRVMLQFAKEARVPVCVHLDHGEDLAYLGHALDMGFTSVMYDGSALPYEENAANTRIAVSLAHRVGASVEAELGSLGKRELGYLPDPGQAEARQVYTDPKDAERFVRETGIDALACSFGTAHGLYLTSPRLNLGLLEEIRRRVDIPLVMHGGSGVSDEDYRAVIARGISKINYYTYMAKAGGEGIQKNFRLQKTPVDKDGRRFLMYYSVVEEERDQPVYYHDIARWGMEAMRENALSAMRVFAGMDRRKHTGF